MPFWNEGLTISEQFTVGLRSAFVASYYAAPLVIAADVALVANVSYYGAVSYHLDPAYGATKTVSISSRWVLTTRTDPRVLFIKHKHY